MEATIVGYILRLYRENGKENGNYYLGSPSRRLRLCWALNSSDLGLDAFHDMIKASSPQDPERLTGTA